MMERPCTLVLEKVAGEHAQQSAINSLGMEGIVGLVLNVYCRPM